MFELKWEWESAPGLSVASHAQTWCRLEMRVEEVVATRVEDRASRGYRDGIYLPLMPLAEWLVGCWWFLLYEGPQHERVVGGRRAASHERAWFARHNWLFAREGYALPDLTLVRVDDDLMWIGQVADPVQGERYPVRFTAEYQRVLPRREVVEGLRTLLDAVADRVGASPDEEAVAFVARWRELSALTGDDRTLRERAAALGLDGDDPAEVDEALASSLVYGFNDIPPVLVPELLAGALVTELESRAQRVRALRSGAPAEPHTGALDIARQRLELPALMASDAEAYRVGWKLAERFRARVLRDESPGVAEALQQRLGDTELLTLVRANAPTGDDAIRGWVSAAATGSAPVVLAPTGTEATRFLCARALGLALQGRRERLITDAATYSQRVSRAFATELLAPLSFVQSRVTRSTVTQAQLLAIAAEAGVQPRVVQHQIENHRLATVVE